MQNEEKNGEAEQPSVWGLIGLILFLLCAWIMRYISTGNWIDQNPYPGL